MFLFVLLIWGTIFGILGYGFIAFFGDMLLELLEIVGFVRRLFLDVLDCFGFSGERLAKGSRCVSNAWGFDGPVCAALALPLRLRCATGTLPVRCAGIDSFRNPTNLN